MMNVTEPNINETVFSSYPAALLDSAAACCIVFAIVGIAGNLLSIVALATCPKLRNATTVFVVNLCIADLLFCAFSLPLSAVTFLEREWNYGETLCKLFPLIRYSNGAVSIFSVIAITFNRYVLVVHPNLYPKIYRTWTIAVMVVSMWATAFVLFSFPLFEVWGRFGYDPTVGTCSILPLDGKSPKTYLYAIAFGLPSLIFIMCYTRIYIVVRKSSKKLRESQVADRYLAGDRISRFSKCLSTRLRISRFDGTAVPAGPTENRKDLHVLRVMLVIFVTFILCYFPVSFVKILKKENMWPILNIVGYLAVYLSNCINPIIYVVMSKEYRMAYRGLFTRSRPGMSEVKKRRLHLSQMNL